MLAKATAIPKVCAAVAGLTAICNLDDLAMPAFCVLDSD